MADPSSYLDVKFAGHKEGSLELLTIIKSYSKDQDVRRKVILSSNMAVLFFLFKDLLAPYAFTDFMDDLVGKEKGLNREEIGKMIEKSSEIAANAAVKKYAQEMMKEFRKDPAINGIGVTLDYSKPPTVIVPRNSFAKLAGIEDEKTKNTFRYKEQSITAILLSPFLQNEKRVWKFSLGSREFGAYIKDHEFLEKALDGRLDIQIRDGIEMDLLLQRKEELNDSVWEIKEYNVIKVLGYRVKPRDPVLPLFNDFIFDK